MASLILLHRPPAAARAVQTSTLIVLSASSRRFLSSVSSPTARAAMQSIRDSGLHRRRVGCIGPSHYANGSGGGTGGRNGANGAANLLPFGQRKTPNGTPKSLVAGMGGRPNGQRQSKSLVAGMRGGHHHQRRANGAAAAVSLATNGSPHPNGYHNGLNGGFKINGASAVHVNGSHTNGATTQVEPKYESDLVVVLDMDECLLHSQFFSHQNSQQDSYRQYEDRPRQSHAFGNDEEAESIITTSVESFRLSLPDGDLVHVNKRPNLDVFLKEITKKFETHVFTAAMEIYAGPVLDTLDPDRTMFSKRFYRESCVLDHELGVYVKDLGNILNPEENQENEMDDFLRDYDEERVVLVDNNPLSFLANPSNGILVSNFYDDPKDDTLEAVMELLHELDGVGDVRPVLDEKFGLREALMAVKIGNGWR